MSRLLLIATPVSTLAYYELSKMLTLLFTSFFPNLHPHMCELICFQMMHLNFLKYSPPPPLVTALLSDDVTAAINCAKRVVQDPQGTSAW